MSVDLIAGAKVIELKACEAHELGFKDIACTGLAQAAAFYERAALPNDALRCLLVLEKMVKAWRFDHEAAGAKPVKFST